MMKRSAILVWFVFLAALLIRGLTPGHSKPVVTCQQPSALTGANCRQLESLMLNATVQIVVQSWQVNRTETGYEVHGSRGLGTVLDGRYLITHNHYATLPRSLSLPLQPEICIRIILYDAQGEFLMAAPLTEFTIRSQESETLVVEMTREADKKLFAQRSVSSAYLDTDDLSFFKPGTEVAQIDWNGVQASVDWVEVQAVITTNGIPRLLLADSVTPGASGGGVFWNGNHVAVNWSLLEYLDGNGIVVGQSTIAALDPEGFFHNQQR
jgi:hypothetical protein